MKVTLVLTTFLAIAITTCAKSETAGGAATTKKDDDGMPKKRDHIPQTMSKLSGGLMMRSEERRVGKEC